MQTQSAQDKARAMAGEGYAISAYDPCLYHVWQPGNRPVVTNGQPARIVRLPYVINVTAAVITCSCPATVPNCKHIAFFHRCQRFWLALDRRATRPVRTRRHFSPKHIALMRSLAPTMAAPAPKPVPQPTPETIARRERMAAMILRDFGPAPTY
jgi:hypothetical protein